MDIVEVVLQGVTGTAGLSRWPLAVPPAGGVVVVPVTERDALVARAAFELLAGITDDSKIASALIDGAEAHRAGVVVVGRDQRRYRVLWDLKAGRRALQVQNGEKYDVITTTQSEIQQALTATVGFPQSDALREVFFAFVEDMPSKRRDVVVDERSGKNARAPGAEKPLPPGFGDAAPARAKSDKPLPPGFDIDAAPARASRWAGKPEAMLRARLQEIEALRKNTKDVGALEFELDGLQKKIFELDARRKPLLDATHALDGIGAQLTALSHLDNLPADFLEQSTTLQKHTAEHNQARDRLGAERARLIETADHLSDEVSGLRQRGGPRPLAAAQHNPFVKSGVLAGVGAIFVGAVGGFAVDALRYVALLDIPAFGVAVFGGVRLLSDLEEGASVRMKLARLDREQKSLDDKFAIDKELMLRLLERAGVKAEGLGEVQALWRRRADLQAQREAAQRTLDDLTAAGDAATLAAEVEQASARMRELEEELANAGQSDGGAAAALDEEVRELEELLGAEPSSSSERKPTLDELFGPPSNSGRLPAAPEAPAPVVAVAVDVGQRIARIASDLLVATLDDTCTRLAPRASQMVNALTDRRFREVRFGAKAEVSVVDSVAGEALPFTQLPPGDRDLVVLALRLSVVEAYTKASPGQNRMPLVFDRTFDAFPVEKAAMFVRVMQFIAQGTQVICLTAQPQIAAAGPTVSAL
jgi:hypothetical protein